MTLTNRIDMSIDDMMPFIPPEVIWLHNGRPFQVMPTNSASMVRCEMFASKKTLPLECKFRVVPTDRVINTYS